MKFTDQEKELILNRYLGWVEQVSEDLEDKSVFSVEDIVYNVIFIIERLK